MPVRDGYEQGRPSWIDISTNDVEGSKAFYAALFGWEWEDQHDPEGNFIYSIARKGGHMVCGLGPAPQEMVDMGIPTVLNTYLSVESVDKSHDDAVNAGATTIIEPFDVMDTGRMAYIADPQGAHVGLWQAGTHKGAQLVNAPCAYTWAELFVPDTEAALKFYDAAVGLGSMSQDMGNDFVYNMFTVGDEPVGGTLPPPMEEVPPHWHVYFGAEDTDACVAKIQELGGSIVAGPMDTPVGKMATVHDATGGTFSVIQLNEWPE